MAMLERGKRALRAEGGWILVHISTLDCSVFCGVRSYEGTLSRLWRGRNSSSRVEWRNTEAKEAKEARWAWIM